MISARIALIEILAMLAVVSCVAVAASLALPYLSAIIWLAVVLLGLAAVSPILWRDRDEQRRVNN